jgi:hypothetical protein
LDDLVERSEILAKRRFRASFLIQSRNIEHSTFNAEHPMKRRSTTGFGSRLGVGCSRLNVSLPQKQ